MHYGTIMNDQNYQVIIGSYYHWSLHVKLTICTYTHYQKCIKAMHTDFLQLPVLTHILGFDTNLKAWWLRRYLGVLKHLKLDNDLIIPTNLAYVIT